MGKPILLLRFEGPLQSWGLRARWDVRDTGDEPSKSAVVGMLGCALGCGCGDQFLEQLEWGLEMAVRVENPGHRATDFQTVSGVFPTAAGGRMDKTIISPRTYLQDAAFLVLLSGSEQLLETCRTALEAAHWPIYLGRKSCPPTRPVLAGVTVEYEDLKDALKRVPWEWEGQVTLRGKYPDRLRCVLEDAGGTALRPDRTRTNPARIYDSRAVRVFWTDFPGLPPVNEEGA
jgi:CRISPR system Cascade subunit CasD